MTNRRGARRQGVARWPPNPAAHRNRRWQRRIPAGARRRPAAQLPGPVRCRDPGLHRHARGHGHRGWPGSRPGRLRPSPAHGCWPAHSNRYPPRRVPAYWLDASGS